ncbi:MAG: redoxin domain-containing protein [Chloroflexota bacterium]|nr:MAG: redoxin domain-containing protein [Chloroflexota bacterium]
MKRNEFLVIAAGLFVGAGLALFIYYVLGLRDANPEEIEEIPGVNLPESASIGSRAPEFELVDLDGQTMKLSEMRGKIVVINFWATWCEPCKVEMPFFEKLHQKELENLEILGINFDEPPLQVEQFVEDYDLHFTILLDPGGKVQQVYRVRGYPTTLIVDGDGIIRYHHIGLITEDQLEHYLSDLGEFE